MKRSRKNIKKKRVNEQRSSTVEASPLLTKARILSKKKTSCSFCGSKEGRDNMIKCKQWNELKVDYVEHVLVANQHDVEILIRIMEHNKPFRKPKTVGKLLTNLSVGKVKHMLTHHLWSVATMSACSLRDMSFEISFLNKSGKV